MMIYLEARDVCGLEAPRGDIFCSSSSSEARALIPNIDPQRARTSSLTLLFNLCRSKRTCVHKNIRQIMISVLLAGINVSVIKWDSFDLVTWEGSLAPLLFECDKKVKTWRWRRDSSVCTLLRLWNVLPLLLVPLVKSLLNAL